MSFFKPNTKIAYDSLSTASAIEGGIEAEKAVLEWARGNTLEACERLLVHVIEIVESKREAKRHD